MEQKPAGIKKVLLICTAVLLTAGASALVAAAIITSITSQQSPSKPSREAALAVFMPQQPKDTQFIDEGYDPKSNCFDKCGYLYRRYSYQDSSMMCKNLYSALRAMGGNFTVTSPSTQQTPSESWCESRSVQSGAFTLDMEAPVKLKTGIKDQSRSVVSVVISPEKKSIEYRVSQTNEGITLIR